MKNKWLLITIWIVCGVYLTTSIIVTKQGNGSILFLPTMLTAMEIFFN